MVFGVVGLVDGVEFCFHRGASITIVLSVFWAKTPYSQRCGRCRRRQWVSSNPPKLLLPRHRHRPKPDRRKFNGSNLSFLGRNSVFSEVRELPIVGGSGLFRFARGYAEARTRTLDMKTGNAVVEYNVYVFHY
ncbi:unnamed protein product, partial [Vitis vinifera]